MRRFHATFLVVVVFFAPSSRATAADKEVAAILDKATKALGGEGKLSNTGAISGALGEKPENRNDVLALLEVARHLSQTDDHKFKSHLETMEPLAATRLEVARKRHLVDGFRILLYFVTLGNVANSVLNDAKQQLHDLSTPIYTIWLF